MLIYPENLNSSTLSKKRQSLFKELRAWILTCHSENYPLNCSALIHAEHLEVSFPCLHYEWKMKKEHVPAPHFLHCHCRCCFHSFAALPRSLLNTVRGFVRNFEMKPRIKLIIYLQKYASAPKFDKQAGGKHAKTVNRMSSFILRTLRIKP